MTDKKILIVEDHPDNGRFLADYFRSNGYEVAWAREAAAALAHCASFRPSVIIAENRVIGQNGETVLELTRANPAFAAIAVICIAVDPMQRQIDRAKALGASAFLAKPCSNDALARLVAKLLENGANNELPQARAMAAVA